MLLLVLGLLIRMMITFVMNIEYMARGTTQYEVANGLTKTSYKTRMENVYDQMGRRIALWLVPIYDNTIAKVGETHQEET
mgnify:CR=1 FL=1